MSEPPDKNKSTFYAINRTPEDSGTPVTRIFRNGEEVGSSRDKAESPITPIVPRLRLRQSNQNKLVSSKLKVERAKRHIGELEAATQAFLNPCPYTLVTNVDPETGDNFITVSIQKEIPADWSPIIGDAVHNLRSALDSLVCDLIRTHTHQDTLSGGFPLKEQSRRKKSTRVGKTTGVSPKAQRLINRLYDCDRWHNVMHALHWLDVIDKHNRVVPVAAAAVRVTAALGLANFYIAADGSLEIGVPSPGAKPFLGPPGVPDDFRGVVIAQDNTEIYRLPFGFQAYVYATFTISVAQTGYWEGESIVETLKQVANLVERTIQVFDRVA